jgi:putative lipoic acid-binding regulatory protein
MRPSEVDLKAFEREAQEFTVKILKFFEKHAYGDKAEKRKAMREAMGEIYEKLRRKICASKNEELDEVMNNIND